MSHPSATPNSRANRAANKSAGRDKEAAPQVAEPVNNAHTSTAADHAKPNARLIHLHAEQGDPQQRLVSALSALEQADWGLALAGEHQLARQLAELLGQGIVRVDGRLALNQQAYAEAGLALTQLHGDLSRARAVWLLDPEPASLERANKLNIPVIVDSTLAPGSSWLERGADFVVYRDAATLSGHDDITVSMLFGKRTAPPCVADSPNALHVALLLRDLATLPLRLARSSRITANLLERLGKEAQAVGPTAILLPPNRLSDTVQPLGGVRAAARNVADGLLMTTGLQDVASVLALLEQTAALTIPTANSKTSSQTPSRQPSQHSSTKQPSPALPTPSLPHLPLKAPRVKATQPTISTNKHQAPTPAQATATQPATKPQPQAPTSESEIIFSPNPPSQRRPIPTVNSGPDPDDAVLDRAKQALAEETLATEATTEAPKELTPEQADTTQSRQPDEPDKPSDDGQAEKLATTDELEAEATVTPEPQQEPETLPAPDLPSPKQSASQLIEGLNDEQLQLYQRLRNWRDDQAKRKNVSLFLIMSNATLIEIVKRLPFTSEELSQVKGIGKSRLEQYGNDILQLIIRYCAKTGHSASNN